MNTLNEISKCAEALIQKLRRLSLGKRKPADRFLVVFLSGGAVAVWTEDGNVILSKDAARKMVLTAGQAIGLAKERNTTA